jgi:anti-sigma B factor antagonist
VERSSGAAPPRQTGVGGEPETNGMRLAASIEPLGANASIVSLSGELDLSTIPLIDKRLLAEASAKGAVIVDLTDVSFIDSTGIGLLIQAFRSCGREGLHTVIARGSQVERVFEVAGIGQALPLFLERGRAIEALNGAASG